ncbi:permease for cytosine/purines uracil thiamine allantoin [Arthrobacter sp. Hiyo8]|nr:permease for cytosine/purines uracil thiamine allantoin [Arthrobacter sp. Hiyo8]
MAKARAIENGVYVAAVSQTPPVSIGYSMLVDPLGTVLHSLDTEPATATLDLSRMPFWQPGTSSPHGGTTGSPRNLAASSRPPHSVLNQSQDAPMLRRRCTMSATTDKGSGRGLEIRSIDYVPLNERHGKVSHIGPLWFVSNARSPPWQWG